MAMFVSLCWGSVARRNPNGARLGENFRTGQRAQRLASAPLFKKSGARQIPRLLNRRGVDVNHSGSERDGVPLKRRRDRHWITLTMGLSGKEHRLIGIRRSDPGGRGFRLGSGTYQPRFRYIRRRLRGRTFLE